MKKVLLCFVAILSFNVLAQDLPEGVYAVDEKTQQPVVNEVPDTRALNHKRPLYFALNLGNLSGTYPEMAKKSNDDSLAMTFTVGYAFTFKDHFHTTSRFNYTSSQQDKEKIRDQDIRSAQNQHVRLVEQDFEFEQEEMSFDQLIGRSFTVAAGNIEPYLGFGFGKGAWRGESKLMTDRWNPQVFSKHNRYTMNTTQEYNVFRYIVGVNFHIRPRFTFLAEYQFHNIQEKKSSRSQSTGDEAVEFQTSQFGDAPLTNASSIQLGAAIRF